VFYIFILAGLRLRVRIALNSALNVWNELERRSKHFFLVLAMRAPISPIHLDPATAQAACESIVLMLTPLPEVIRDCGDGQDHYGIKNGSL
jgi:hypothetical protein